MLINSKIRLRIDHAITPEYLHIIRFRNNVTTTSVRLVTSTILLLGALLGAWLNFWPTVTSFKLDYQIAYLNSQFPRRYLIGSWLIFGPQRLVSI